MFRTSYASARPVSAFMYKVYGWMSAGLALTGATAALVYSHEALMNLIVGTPLVYVLMGAQFLFVIAISGFISRMSFALAATLFVLYSMSLGATLSVIFMVYQLSSIGMVFGLTAGMFTIMALYGYYTKADLTSFGNIMRMGLWGVIIASLINIFMRNPMLDLIMSFIAVAVFTGLTAYNVQEIKHMGSQLSSQGETENKIALVGALSLYLNFINLFLHLLRLLGNRRD